MANPEHLEILKQGVEVWNKWREGHIERVVPDLTDADLNGIKLDDANFRSVLLGDACLRGADLKRAIFCFAKLGGADLSRAHLTGADLSGADLIGADLRYADLSGARLHGTILSYTNLSGARFSGADLRDAYLRRAVLIGSIVNGADFTKSTMGGTTLANIDLSKVKGLATIEHYLRSSVGIDTVYKSAGKIPEAFLRGCGVPESFIVQIRALVASTDPIQFYSCFISYSSKNQLFADRLYADLQNKGVRCWLASEDLKIGDKTRIAIDESIRFHDKLLLVLSKYSVASDWVEQEVETAVARERKEKRTVLFPIRLDDVVMKIDTGWPALIKNTRNIGDFRKWRNPEAYQKAFDKLLHDLKADDQQTAEG